MLLSGQAHTVGPADGRIVDLGITRMRVLAAGEETTGRAFTLAEFAGDAGPWTVPHLHRAMEESFFVLDGSFTFAVGEDEIEAAPGAYVLVPRGTRHLITAGAAGSRCLVLMVPGGQVKSPPRAPSFHFAACTAAAKCANAARSAERPGLTPRPRPGRPARR
jgi:quercetin dioxygenase-like cupin family protein